MAALVDIERAVLKYSESHTVVRELAQDLDDEIRMLKRLHIKAIKTAVNKAQKDRTKLSALIDESPGLFEKPRSLAMHGIKFGLQKLKGSIVIDNPKQTIKLIKKSLPDQVDELIAVKESPAKKALEKLTANILKKIGVSVKQDTDIVMIKSSHTDIDKFVDSLLKDDDEKIAA